MAVALPANPDLVVLAERCGTTENYVRQVIDYAVRSGLPGMEL
jgi:hypothetical protein